MRILFIGDIVGRAGRRVVEEELGALRREKAVDFTIANVENVAAGFGLTPRLGEEILGWGVDVMTSGNHIFDRREVFDYFELQPRLLRPGNYPPGTPGRYRFLGKTADGIPVAVLNFQGRVFMPTIDCPFRMAESEISLLSEQARVIVVDFHAEATSEKMAFGWFLDGQVSAILGTHTHVPTCDQRILAGGTAYVSDVGMTGSYESVIGMEVDSALPRFLTAMRTRFKPAAECPRLCAVLVDVDEKTGKARSIERLGLGAPPLPPAGF